jgi:hypothetical protein
VIIQILLLEGGVNLSVSVHEELYQTHRAGVGINVRASMRISPKTELGIRGEYDYRFVRNISPDTRNCDRKSFTQNFSLFALNQMCNLTLRETGFRS